MRLWKGWQSHLLALLRFELNLDLWNCENDVNVVGLRLFRLGLVDKRHGVFVPFLDAGTSSGTASFWRFVDAHNESTQHMLFFRSR